MPGGRETSLGTRFLVRPGSCREHNPWRGVFCCGHHNKREEGGLKRFYIRLYPVVRLSYPTGQPGWRPLHSSISITLLSRFRLPTAGQSTPLSPPSANARERMAHALAGVCPCDRHKNKRGRRFYILPFLAVAPFQRAGKLQLSVLNSTQTVCRKRDKVISRTLSRYLTANYYWLEELLTIRSKGGNLRKVAWSDATRWCRTRVVCVEMVRHMSQ